MDIRSSLHGSIYTLLPIENAEKRYSDNGCGSVGR
jgi:hypothetical protein